MHKLLAALVSLSLSLSLTLAAAGQDNVGTAPSLTIYNQNFFVARDHVTLDLKPGANHIDFAGVTAHLEPDSVILRDLTIWFGNSALVDNGVDSLIENCFLSGYTAAVTSQGANWYVRDKLDTIGAYHSTYGFLQGVPFAGASSAGSDCGT